MEYALNDAKYTYQIWEKLYPDWPEEERMLSQATRDMAWDGVPGQTAKLFSARDELLKRSSIQRITCRWYGEIDPDTKKEYVVYSKKSFSD